MFFLRIFLAATRVQTIVPTSSSATSHTRRVVEFAMNKTTPVLQASHASNSSQPSRPQFINLKQLEHTNFSTQSALTSHIIKILCTQIHHRLLIAQLNSLLLSSAAVELLSGFADSNDQQLF